MDFFDYLNNAQKADERAMRMMIARAVVGSEDPNIPKSLVERARLVIESEELNDQLINVLTMMKAILGDFDPNAPGDFIENLSLFNKLTSLPQIPVFNFGERLREFMKRMQACEEGGNDDGAQSL